MLKNLWLDTRRAEFSHYSIQFREHQVLAR
jgi:hypothetical protein